MEQRQVYLKSLNDALLGLELMARALIKFESTSRSTLGFSKTTQYRGITFHVGDRFVIPDLRPLAFLVLLEEIDDDTADAIVRLYDRVAPLLICRHEWVPDQRLTVNGLATEDGPSAKPGLPTHMCKLCTAYALGGRLPQVGRDIET